MKEKNKNVNLQTINQISLPKHQKKKLEYFMYSSALATTMLAGFQFLQQNFFEGATILGCSSGIWAFSNSLHTNNQNYVKRLTLYRNCSMLSSASFLLQGITKPETATLIVTLFCSGNMLLLGNEFRKEKKCYTLSKTSQTIPVDDQK